MPGPPGANALQFSERIGGFRCAFLSPLDYARHGAEYCIVPSVAASAAAPNGVLQLFVRSDLRSISTVAVDVRFTSEILLTKIILQERYRNASGAVGLTFIPAQGDVNAMLAKADAALVVNLGPGAPREEGPFSLDLVEEWIDMTELPYPFGFWVGREEELTGTEARALVDAKGRGVSMIDDLARDLAATGRFSTDETRSYLHSFSYEFGDQEEQALDEFMRYAFFHGALPDVPDIQYFEIDSPSAGRN